MAQLKDTNVNGNIELTGKLMLPNTIGIYALDTDGNYRQNIQPCNASNNCVIGYGNYTKSNGNTNIYGNDIMICSAAAGNTNFRPYYRAGDSINFSFRGAGYVTNSSQDVTFLVPFSAPIIGSPTVTASSVNGLTLRQGSKYTHGSSATAYATPNSYSTILIPQVGVVVTAKFTSNTTNATNNDATGVYWSGNITFS